MELFTRDQNGWPISAKKPLEVVCSMVSLRSLTIDCLDTTAGDHISLSYLTNLSRLEWDTTRLERTTRESLVQLTQLRYLKVVHYDLMEDATVAWLRDVSGSLLHLTTLKLSFQNYMTIKPHHLLPLTTLRALKEVELDFYCGVEAEGLSVLKALPITRLMFTIKFGEVGEVCSWLQGGGGKLNTLLVYADEEERLSFPEVEMLMSHLCTWAPHLRALQLSWMTQLGHSTGLAGLTQLTSLRLRGDGNGDGATLLQLCALTGLQELDMYGSQVTLGAVGSFECLASCLQQLTCLRSLSEEALVAAKRGFGSRVVKARVVKCCTPACQLLLKPGVPAGGLRGLVHHLLLCSCSSAGGTLSTLVWRLVGLCNICYSAATRPFSCYCV
jgi:hypothetical protein